jgi:MFS family permease
MFPESPRWLALQNRYDEARDIFAIIEHMDPNDERVALDLEAVIRANDMLAEAPSFLSLFVYGKQKTLWRLILAVSCQFFTQMNGAGIITYYSKQLFENIGLSANLSGILSSTSLTFKFICCFIAFLTIEVAGRKRLFLISMSGMSMCMVSSSSYCFQQNDPS